MHRFYLGNKNNQEIHKFGEQRMWLQNKDLIHQWKKVLRFRVGEKVGLFDDSAEFIYSITEIKQDEITLQKITEVVRNTPDRKLLLAWSILKKGNNDLILQKATEIGVTHFVPLASDRSEKTGFDSERATKIVIEAVEQCGRSDIPIIENIVTPQEAVSIFQKHYRLFVANMNGYRIKPYDGPTGIFIGPEGGWSDHEIRNFEDQMVEQVCLSPQTLRAETAAIIASYAIQ